MTSDAQKPASRRREQITLLLQEQGYCSIQELAQRFGVSDMTIRRDVALMQSEGKARAFHGGVGSIAPADISGIDYSRRDASMIEAKRLIAEHAVRELSPHSVIAIDAGTTGAQLASAIPHDYSLTVISHSLPVISALAGRESTEVICLGGVLHPESLSFDGPNTLHAISNLSIGTLYLTASGLSERGVFCGNSFDAITKRALIDVSEKVVLLADSSKFSITAMVRTCEWDSIDRIIIDRGLSAENAELLARHGVEVEISNDKEQLT